MITKVNMFNFGSPAFILSIVRYLYPKIATPGDYVVKEGEFADEIFFIKSGQVEVLATDNKTRIAILKDGAYFGEIGVFITGTRSVSVKALTVCEFQVISKADFERLMEEYPVQADLLKKVALQRMKIKTEEDIPKKESDKSSISRAKSDQSENGEKIFDLDILSDSIDEGKSQGSPAGCFIKILDSLITRIKPFASSNDQISHQDVKGFVFVPSSLLSNVWTGLLMISVMYNLVLFPYDITFGGLYENCDAHLLGFEIFSGIIYFFDMFIHANTAIKAR